MKKYLGLLIFSIFFLSYNIIFAEENPTATPSANTSSAPNTMPVNSPPEKTETAAIDLDSIPDPFISKLPKEPEPPPPMQAGPTMQMTPSVNPTPGESSKEIKPPPILVVTGLVWNSDNPQAIVNNDIKSIGDKIEEWTIVKIGEEGIVLTNSGKKIIFSNRFDK